MKQQKPLKLNTLALSSFVSVPNSHAVRGGAGNLVMVSSVFCD